MNAAKPSFPTSIVGIVTTCFGWARQGSTQEGFTGIHEYTMTASEKPGRGDNAMTNVIARSRPKVPAVFNQTSKLSSVSKNLARYFDFYMSSYLK